MTAKSLAERVAVHTSPNEAGIKMRGGGKPVVFPSSTENQKHEKWKPKILNKVQRLTITPHYLAGWSKGFLEPNPALGRQEQAVRLRPSCSTRWVQTSYIVQPSLKKEFIPPPHPTPIPTYADLILLTLDLFMCVHVTAISPGHILPGKSFLSQQKPSCYFIRLAY